MSDNIKIFSIDKLINPSTNLPFGDNYAGEFRVRRPTLADETEISIMDAANLNKHGRVDADQVRIEAGNNNYIFTKFKVIGEKIPDWFNATTTYDTDQPAINAAYKEVADWLATFQP